LTLAARHRGVQLIENFKKRKMLAIGGVNPD
jgi:hypothetical protein